MAMWHLVSLFIIPDIPNHSRAKCRVKTCMMFIGTTAAASVMSQDCENMPNITKSSLEWYMQKFIENGWKLSLS